MWEDLEAGHTPCFGHTFELEEHTPRTTTLLRESIIIPGLCRRMSVAVVGLVCSDELLLALIKKVGSLSSLKHARKKGNGGATR